MKREKHASYSRHDSCKSLSEELSDYYKGLHSSHTKHHSQRREKDRRPQEVNKIKTSVRIDKKQLKKTVLRILI